MKRKPTSQLSPDSATSPSNEQWDRKDFTVDKAARKYLKRNIPTIDDPAIYIHWNNDAVQSFCNVVQNANVQIVPPAGNFLHTNPITPEYVI